MIVPIIGSTRTWKDLAFRAQPLAEQPAIMSPFAKPKVIGYAIGMVATRSDDFPCQMMIMLKTEDIGSDPVPAMLNVFAMLVNNLETFRTCACIPGHPCQLHQQNTQGKPS